MCQCVLRQEEEEQPVEKEAKVDKDVEPVERHKVESSEQVQYECDPKELPP